MTANANQANAQRPRISMVVDAQQKWEYRQEFNCTPTDLTKWGHQGWRLVGPPVIAKMSLGSSGRLLYVFERPVQTP
jgi:hypothetical protein